VEKQGVHARNVLFGLLRVNFVVHLVVLKANGEKADAVDATRNGTSRVIVEADLEPESVAHIGEQEKRKNGEERAPENASE
jgi:hypothetical protein